MLRLTYIDQPVSSVNNGRTGFVASFENKKVAAMKKQPLLPKHTKTLFETEGRKATSCKSITGCRPVFCVRKIDITNIGKAAPIDPHDLSEG